MIDEDLFFESTMIFEQHFPSSVIHTFTMDILRLIIFMNIFNRTKYSLPLNYCEP